MEDARQYVGSPLSTSTLEFMCRICHEGESKECLYSFCRCAGSLALAHRSCLEKWLSTANSSHCEICKYNFKTARRPRPVVDWFRNSDSTQDTNNFIGDAVCFIVLTPLTIVSSYLCVLGAMHYFGKRGASWEASGLIILAIILTIVYCIWLGATIRHHLRTVRKWRATHQCVELLSVRSNRVSCTASAEENNNTSNDSLGLQAVQLAA